MGKEQMEPVPVTLGGRGVGAGLRGKTGKALVYFRDLDGDSWAVIEMDRDASLLIIHQSYLKEN